MYCLDTSAVLELFYETEKGKKISQLVYNSPICITSFTVHELTLGLRNDEKEKIDLFFKETLIISFDKSSAQKSALIERELYRKGSPINKVDVFIAGICSAIGLSVVTCDKDFAKVNGLTVHLY
ncbi:MAG TPA: type II toxin-antitoxin system VapC family toxin [Candidatus Nanoarchaeia archaeon]|nr:type II toxin-antitoxin system VapC family toxin [Candidatus Nanoarchaeia archaeon]